MELQGKRENKFEKDTDQVVRKNAKKMFSINSKLNAV